MFLTVRNGYILPLPTIETALLESRIRFISLFKLILDEWEDLDDPVPGYNISGTSIQTTQ